MLLISHGGVAVAADLEVIRGDWEGDIEIAGSPGDRCDDPSGIINPGQTVTLTDEEGTILGETQLSVGHINNEGFCSYGFTFWGIPERDRYLFEVELGSVATMEPHPISYRSLDAANWSPQISLRTSYFLEARGGVPAQPSSSSSSDMPTAAPEPTSVLRQQITPRGETLIANGWELSVVDAQALPDLNGVLAYNVVITLNVRNTEASPRQFGEPDMEFQLRSAQGWGGRYDYVKTAQTSVALDEWQGHFTKGYDYEYTTVFSVSKWDPNLHQDGLSGWVLTITDGSFTYVLEIGDLQEP